MFEKGEVAIQAEASIVGVAGGSRISIGHNRSHIRAGKDVFLDPRHAEVPARNSSECAGLDVE